MKLTETLFKATISIFFLFSAFFLQAEAPYKYNLAATAIFQNEAPYLREWIEFHKLVGVEHFYLYNNHSSDHYQATLKPYIKAGIVDLIEWGHSDSDISNWNNTQIAAYIDAINKSKHIVKWLIIVDIDEYIFPVETDNLSTFLQDYEGVPAVCANWQMYGTSGVKKIQSKDLLIEKLIYKAPADHVENIHVKSIVRPEFVEYVPNPHFCCFLPGLYQVNSNKEPFEGPFSSPIRIDKIRINHYWTKDENFFYNVKIPRRQKWQDGGIIERANTLNKEIDKAIYKYVPQLKKVMNKK